MDDGGIRTWGPRPSTSLDVFGAVAETLVYLERESAVVEKLDFAVNSVATTCGEFDTKNADVGALKMLEIMVYRICVHLQDFVVKDHLGCMRDKILNVLDLVRQLDFDLMMSKIVLS